MENKNHYERKEKRKAILLLSGGLDSTTALYWALDQGYKILGLSINFYLRSPNERRAVKKISEITNITVIEVDIPFLKEIEDVKLEGYLSHNLDYPQGYIPKRNLLFYTIAAYYAEIYEINTIIGGHLSSDSDAFPDATQSFFIQLQNLLNTSKTHQTHKIDFLFPFLQMTKTQVVNLGKKLDVPFEYTWSCYFDNKHPCGHCHPCQERQVAFKQAIIKDLLNFI